MLSGPYEIRAPSSSMRLSVLFREESTMTPERRRLALENLVLENQALSERIRIAREIGATDRDLAPLLNELIYKPLVALDRYQDKGLIEGAELIRLPGRDDA